MAKTGFTHDKAFAPDSRIGNLLRKGTVTHRGKEEKEWLMYGNKRQKQEEWNLLGVDDSVWMAKKDSPRTRWAWEMNILLGRTRKEWVEMVHLRYQATDERADANVFTVA
jgi:hypothetical protein